MNWKLLIIMSMVEEELFHAVSQARILWSLILISLALLPSFSKDLVEKLGKLPPLAKHCCFFRYYCRCQHQIIKHLAVCYGSIYGRLEPCGQSTLFVSDQHKHLSLTSLHHLTLLHSSRTCCILTRCHQNRIEKLVGRPKYKCC